MCTTLCRLCDMSHYVPAALARAQSACSILRRVAICTSSDTKSYDGWLCRDHVVLVTLPCCTRGGGKVAQPKHSPYLGRDCRCVLKISGVPLSHIVSSCPSLALPKEASWWQPPVFDQGARWKPKTPNKWRAPGALLPVATSEDHWISMHNRCECAGVVRRCAHTNVEEAQVVRWPCLSGA